MFECRGPSWDVDDFSPCAKQKYIQTLPIALSGVVSLAIVARSVRKSIKKRQRAKEEDRQPLLNQHHSVEDQEENDLFVKKSVTYGAVFNKSDNEQEPDFEDVGENKNSPAVIATVVRPTSERIRVSLEWIAAALQLALSLVASFGISSIYREWIYSPLVPWTSILFWAYMFVLVSIRLSYMGSQQTADGGLWYHSTSLYPIAALSDLVLLRSSLIHPISGASEKYYIARFCLSATLFGLNCSARFGNKPARLYLTHRHPNPEPISSIFEILTFSWATKFIWEGYWRYTEGDHVWELQENDHAYHAIKRFRKFKAKYSFAWSLLKTFRVQFILGALYAIIFATSVFGPAIFVKLILDYVQDPSRVPRNVAWLYVSGILALGMIKSMANGQALFIGRRVGLRLRSILIGEIYAKALRRKTAASGTTKLGERGENDPKKDTSTQANVGAIINLMSIDAYKISDVPPGLHNFVSGILQIFIALSLLYMLLGWSAFVGAAAMCCFIPANYWLARQFGRLQAELMKQADQRVEKTNELLNSIRILKLFAWEHKFAETVREWREKELHVLKIRYLHWSFGPALFMSGPLVVTSVSFASYTMLQKEQLTSSIAFTAMTLFNLLKGPMDQLSFLLSGVLQAKVSYDRIMEFLMEDETEKYHQLANPVRGPNSPVIGFENASFSWKGGNSPQPDQDGSSEGRSSSDGTITPTATTYNFRLRDLDISFPVGKLSVIAGPTGSGKTSLLMALLGEMDLESGKVFLPGACSREEVKADPNTGLCETVAYCSQQAWLLNDTLRNNILFAADYDEDRYNAVIEACALKRDLEILPDGDQTEVGEKGIALSGGQKQRISLARAVYSKSKHVILDDCLSAVDSHTALYIYNNCIAGDVLNGRTVILVSHNVALTITDADTIIVMDNGRIKAQGSPIDVVNSGALGDDELIKNNLSESQTPSRVNSSTTLNKPDQKLAKKVAKKIAAAAAQEAPSGEAAPPPDTDTRLVKDETMSRGVVKSKVYTGYLSALGGYWFWIGAAGFLLLQHGSQMTQAWWVREWTVKGLATSAISSSHYGQQFVDTVNTAMIHMNVMWSNFKTMAPEPEAHSTLYYVGIYLGIGFTMMVAVTLKELVVYMAAVHASRVLFDRLLDSILNAKSRFFDSTPIGRIMNRFSKDIEGIDQDLPVVTHNCAACLLVVTSTLGLIIYITPGFLFPAAFICVIYYAVASMYLASSRELKRIEAVTRSPIFQHFGETLVGISTIRAYGDQRRFIRDNMRLVDGNHGPYFYLWVANRWLYFRVDFIGALVSVGAAAFVLWSIGRLDSGLAGISLSYAMSFNETVLWSVRLFAEAELQFNSVERVQEYTEIESEAPAVIPDSRPPINWPSKGEIEFKNVGLRYAPELPLVIKDATFKVEPFNKIGIVGRTGAGKSTIITALFRLLEADHGKILIDGLDISTIGLQDLRQGLAIIPQDPTLFHGTIRSNLDPFNYYSDKQVLEALRRVHLISQAEAEDTKSVSTDSSENSNQFTNLQSSVTEGGSNLSQGQRQLMCLARSLLKNPKVLLLDEATASIDYETDAQIQNTIREEFNETTLLTIAHRLRSIADYDKILVMDAGQIIEYDEPLTLIRKQDGVFRDMCLKSGDFDTLEQLASDAFNKKHQ